MRVGEKEISEQAAIVERFRDLFSSAQVDVLRAAEESASGDERELLYRLRKTCESGIISAELAAREDELENRILAARVVWHGEEMPLRNAQAKLAVLTAYSDRDELGALANAVNAGFNDDRRELLAAGEALEAELSGEPDRGRTQRGREGNLAARARAGAGRSQPASPPTPTTACATAGSRSFSAPSARSFRPRTTRATCAVCLRSTRRTPRSRPSRSASRRSPHSVSTSRARPGSGSTWTTGRRSPRARASSPPIRRTSSI